MLSLRLLLPPYGSWSSWLLMAPHASSWLLLGLPHGSLWLLLAPCVPSWSSWLLMAPPGPPGSSFRRGNQASGTGCGTSQAPLSTHEYTQKPFSDSDGRYESPLRNVPPRWRYAQTKSIPDLSQIHVRDWREQTNTHLNPNSNGSEHIQTTTFKGREIRHHPYKPPYLGRRGGHNGR